MPLPQPFIYCATTDARDAVIAERRLRNVHVSVPLIERWIKHGVGSSVPVGDHLPADAHLVEVAYDYLGHSFALTFAHTSFAPVPDGHKPPTMTPTFRHVDVTAERTPR